MLAPLSCPDCGGVLSFREEGRHSQKLYVCQIGHRYSVASLWAAKEDRVEYTLWSAVVQLTQLQLLCGSVAQTKVLPAGSTGTSIRRRIREAEQHCAAIRALIEGTHVVE